MFTGSAVRGPSPPTKLSLDHSGLARLAHPRSNIRTLSDFKLLLISINLYLAVVNNLKLQGVTQNIAMSSRKQLN
jgi:hypothetical protein